MYAFSDRSKRELMTCHRDLQRVFSEVIKHWDCSILEGHRSEEDQAEMLRTGRSTVAWPTSKHNTTPSAAVDVAPYPVDWEDAESFRAFGGFVLGVATMMGVTLRWGGDWSMDWDFHDQKFVDLPHFELVMK